MAETPALERLLKRDRAITLAGLATLCALAWLYILMGPGLGMSAWEMTRFALFPHRELMSGMDMGGMATIPAPTSWNALTWALMTAMWWIMMIAMMAPSAAPTILLYAKVHRHARAQHGSRELAPTGAFTAGYALVWLGFSIIATALHWLLERQGALSAMTMDSRSRWLSGAVLIAAGAYQLSPLKNVCLSHCRAPASFLSRHWRPYRLGAVRLGAMHGAYCAGCCWMLMTLLFVGGVMNLIWIAALACLVLIEKLLPGGRWISRGAGIVLIAWGVATLMV